MAEKHGVSVVSVEEFSGDQKRIKLEEMEDPEHQQSNTHQQHGPNDPHNAPPSKVVHARAVPDGCTHQQMIALMQKYGTIA